MSSRSWRTERPAAREASCAFLFAAAHVPGALAEGASPADLLPLLLDFGLGIGVLAVVARSADIWWFWSVHFALDRTQFAAT